MCYAVKCNICGKTTWAGCGQHVDEVMRNVPPAERCPGHSAEERRAAQRPRRFTGIFGRR